MTLLPDLSDDERAELAARQSQARAQAARLAQALQNAHDAQMTALQAIKEAEEIRSLMSFPFGDSVRIDGRRGGR
jgi:hypothetical protein